MPVRVALVILVLGSFAANAAPSPPVEIGDIPLEPSFEFSRGGSSNVVFHPTLPIGYAASGDHLFVFDARDGSDLGGFDLRSLASERSEVTWDLTVVSGRLVATWTSANTLAVLSLETPNTPRLLTSSARWTRPRIVARFDDGFLVVASEARELEIVEVETLGTAGVLSPLLSPWGGFWSHCATGGSGSDAWLACTERTIGSPQRFALEVWSVAAGAPSLRFLREIPYLPKAFVGSRSGSLLVAASYDPSIAPRQRVEAIEPTSGATISSWVAERDATLELTESGGTAVVQIDPLGIDFVDLADPTDPRPIGRVERQSSPRFPDDRPVAVSASSSLVWAMSAPERKIVAIDSRTAKVLSAVTFADARPWRLVLGERPDGTRSIASVSLRYDETGLLARGGLSHVDLVDWSAADRPGPPARFLRNHPDEVEAVAALAGRYVAAYDSQSNSLALVSLAESRVVQVTGAIDRLGEFETRRAVEPVLRGVGGVLLVAGRRGWERFELRNGRLEPLDSHLVPPGIFEWYQLADLSPNGTVVALGARYVNGYEYFLDTFGADGRRGSAPRPNANYIAMTFSPAGNRSALATRRFDGVDGIQLWDIADPDAPRREWLLRDDVVDAVFDPTGSRLLASGPSWGNAFHVETLDADTGAPVSGSSEEIAMFEYHGFGAQWVAGARWRAIYWAWTWSSWRNVMVDLTASPPAVVRVFDHDEYFPEFAPRDGGGWYETRWDPRRGRSNVVVGDPSGEVGIAPAEGWHWAPTPIRRGVFATARVRSRAPGVTLWLDRDLAPPAPFRAQVR
jgi:hypothetical protein